MDFNAPPPSDDELPQVVVGLIAQARSPDLDDRRVAIEKLYELAYKVGSKIADAIPVLIDGLFDRDDKIGESSLWALMYCKPDSIEPLIDCLAHPEAFVRERAAHSLGNIGDEARPAALRLRSLLADEEQAVRKRAAWSLGLMHDADTKTIAALTSMAEHGSPVDRGAAFHALGNIGKSLDDPSVFRHFEPIIMDALADPDGDVRWSALYLTESLDLEPRRAADLMFTLLTAEQPNRVVEAALSRLKVLAPLVDLTPRVDTIVTFLDQPARSSLACQILSLMRPAPIEAIEPLQHALQNDDLVLPAASALWAIEKRVDLILPALERVFERDGESVCDLITELGPAAAPLVPKLIDALSQENWDLQWAAADALGAVASPEPLVMSTLVGALAHPSPIVRSSSARALARTGHAAIPTLRSLVTDPSDHRSAWAAYALGEMGPIAAAVMPELRLGMRSREDPLSICCAIALAQVGGDLESIPYLIAALRSDSPQTPRRAAASALGHLGPAASEAVEALEALLDDEDFNVVQAAETALGVIRRSAH